MKSNINLELMKQACDDLGLMYTHLPIDKDLFFNAYIVRDKISGKQFLSSDWALYPSQSTWQSTLMKYKDMTNQYLSFSGFSTIDGKYFSSTTDKDVYTSIEQYITKYLSYPVVIKPNNRSKNKGVSLVKNQNELQNYLNTYSEFSPDLLVQQYIADAREYRVFIYKGHIEFMYERSDGEFLKEPGSRDSYQTNNYPEFLKMWASKVYKVIDAPIIGADIFIKNELIILIELNGNPALRVITEHYNDKDRAINIWKRILTEYFTQ